MPQDVAVPNTASVPGTAHRGALSGGTTHMLAMAARGVTMESGALSRRLDEARAAAREAGRLALRRFRERPRGAAFDLKGDQDYLSAVDSEVEQLLKARFAQKFPEDGFFGEEAGGRFTDTTWMVDPVDGTANFVRGIPQWCVAIALIHHGAAVAAVTYDPNADEVFSAGTGLGASLNGAPMAVSTVTALNRATIEAGWSSREPRGRYVAMVDRLLESGAGVRRGGSGALALAYVAAGRLDGYCELHMNAWDAAGGLLLVAEAGGGVNDFLAGEGLSHGGPVLATNGRLHAALARLTGID